MAKKNKKTSVGPGLLILCLIAVIFFAAQGCGTNNVTLTADPAGSATLTGAGQLAKGEEVTVSAQPAQGWEFVNWTLDGEVVAETEDYTFIVQGRRNLMANLRPIEYTIAAFAQGQGSIDYPEGMAHGDEVTVKAVPASGYRFAYWSEDGEVVSTDADYSFTAGGDRNLTATFLPESHVLDIEIDGEGGDVIETWDSEAEVTLKAVARDGYEFFGWVDVDTGQEVETETVLSFAWEGERRIMARFREQLVQVDGSSLVAVVGKQTTIGQYEPDDLVELPSHISRKNRMVRSEVAEALEMMEQVAQAEGVDIDVDSGYRSFSTQSKLFYRYANNDGVFAAERYSARPGQSEHQLGTAVDFGGTNKDYSSAFFNTTQGTWLFENAHKFGFALSYPKDSEEITGYIYEPWHYRYIGEDLAMEWKESGLTLIEFLKTKPGN